MSSISSTRPSDGRLRLLLVLFAGLLAAWAGLSFTLERVARWAELERGDYLWFMEEWLQLMQPQDFEGRGERMIMLTGASEAREGLLFERFGKAFPEAVAYHAAQSLGIMKSVLLQIEYIDRVYGASGFPHRIVLGVTPRFVYNVPRVTATPIFNAVNRYSPRLGVDAVDGDYRFFEKSTLESLKSRYRFLTKQTRRYRNALRAVARAVAERVAPSLAETNVLTVALRPYKYQHLGVLPHEPHWERFRNLEPVPYTIDGPDGQTVLKDAGRFLEIAGRHGSEVYVVALPEAPWMKPHYAGTFHDDYVDLLRRGYGPDRVLDLRHILSEDQFYDQSHATREGAELISRAIIDWMKGLDPATQ